MTARTETQPTPAPALGRSIASALGHLLEAVFSLPSARAAMLEIERLETVTDADLAARGTTRDAEIRAILGRHMPNL